MTPPVYPPPGLRQREAALRRRPVHRADNPDVREVVRLRAGDACEYCLLPTTGAFEVEHIIPPGTWDDYLAGRLRGLRPARRRRGPDHIDNYAWSCPFCNRAKGGRVAAGTGQAASRFFDPRRDRWPDHFVFAPATGYLIILGATVVGASTAGPLVPRHLAILAGAYPPIWTRAAYGL